jgi:hypothetical protein
MQLANASRCRAAATIESGMLTACRTESKRTKSLGLDFVKAIENDPESRSPSRRKIVVKYRLRGDSVLED